MKATKKLNIGCTAARHAKIGINAVVNARGGQQWRNDLTHDEIEQMRDGRSIRDWLGTRTRFYTFYSRFFQRNRHRLSHLLSSYKD